MYLKMSSGFHLASTTALLFIVLLIVPNFTCTIFAVYGSLDMFHPMLTIFSEYSGTLENNDHGGQ